MNAYTSHIRWLAALGALLLIVVLSACGESPALTATPISSGRDELVADGGSGQDCDWRHDFIETSVAHVLHWSPDGEHLLFNYRATLFVVDAAGTRLRTLVDAYPQRADSYPEDRRLPHGIYADLSPDGTRVVYTSCEYQATGIDPKIAVRNYEIAIINLDGSGKRRLTGNWTLNHNPVWSPDGERIALTASYSNVLKGQYLYTMAPDESNVTLNVRRRVYDIPVEMMPPVWSPDGKYLAFLGHGPSFGVKSSSSVNTLRLEDLKVTRIATLGRPNNTRFETGYMPTWSPDGEHLVFVMANEEGGSGGIYTARPDGTDLELVLEPQGTDWDWQIQQVLWSPDGSEILAVTKKQLYLVQPDGGGLRTIELDTIPHLRSEVIAAWSPDGTRIALYVPFNSSDRYSTELYTIARDGTDRHDLITLDNDGNLAPANPPQETP